MKGKIFPESSNIYQDQAKILFNYYQSMAEKIVQEEERIEKEIAKLEEERSMLNKDLSKAKLWKWVLCVLIIPFIYFMIKENGIVKQINSLDERINEFNKQHKEIFRDYKVNKLGVAYVPIADQIKYENKSFIVDHTGMVEESEVKLQLSKQNDLLIETISELEKLSGEAPIVESSTEIEEIETEQYSKSMQQLNQHDYFGKLERSLRTISYCMDDLDVTSVQLPLVANESSYLNFLKEFATNEVPENAPVFKAFDTQKYNEQISKFQELNKLKDSLSRHTAQFEDVLKGLMLTMANSVQAISALKVASTDKIVFESNKVLYKILKSPYNHYSPVLEASEIERIRNESFNYSEAVSDYVPFQLKDSSKVRFNLVSGMWTAEDGSTTNFPFGVHQIHEEIVAPIVQNLMNETRIERLKIYNHIKDQKISYLNKWHQDTEDFYGRNRAESADLINLMRASLRDYVAAYNTLTSLKKTEDSMAQSGGSLDSTVVTATENSAEVFAAFELQSKEFQNVQLDFENYMERLKEDIDMKAQKFEHIDYYDALLRDGISKEIAVAADEVHDFDARRKPLITVNPLFAKTSDLPPTPDVEDITFEHISLNLPNIAKNTLRELEDDLVIEQPISEENDEIESTNIESDIENNVESDDNIIENQDADDNSESEEKEDNNDASDEDEEDFSDEDENDDSESDNEDSEDEEDEEDFSDEDENDDSESDNEDSEDEEDEEDEENKKN
ncbi:hypothetical protein BZG02_12875 [Labilibaculum filiforme]|uniref:Uncharacterized protein n=1 Tax=Labilibaculum filiforme TaxID=1940526 RepID=A0A2N3HVW1_9BACT|nr:hypothetical protein [Labilibaculum filiforme]PKQ62206.1 hypothetical protein BZG02_12875 [Labilibaculum filiforme]